MLIAIAPNTKGSGPSGPVKAGAASKASGAATLELKFDNVWNEVTANDLDPAVAGNGQDGPAKAEAGEKPNAAPATAENTFSAATWLTQTGLAPLLAHGAQPKASPAKKPKPADQTATAPVEVARPPAEPRRLAALLLNDVPVAEGNRATGPAPTPDAIESIPSRGAGPSLSARAAAPSISPRGAGPSLPSGAARPSGKNPLKASESPSIRNANAAETADDFEPPEVSPRIAADQGSGTGPVAFELKLTPTPSQTNSLPYTVTPAPTTKPTEPAPGNSRQAVGPLEAHESGAQQSSRTGGNETESHAREQGSSPDAERTQPPATRSHSAPAATSISGNEDPASHQASALSATPPVAAAAPVTPAAVPANPPAPSTPAPASPPHAAPAAETASAAPPASPASDIHLEVPTENGKVDVRVVERGGDVHVSVRTADSHLAGNLRDGLPALSAKLEESGFRSDSWRPALTGERRAETPATTRTLSSDQQFGDPNRGRQQQPQQQNQRSQAKGSGSKTERNNFAWLFTSIR